MMTGCSAVLVARLNGVQEAVSSTLATRTKAIDRMIDGFFIVECRGKSLPFEGKVAR